MVEASLIFLDHHRDLPIATTQKINLSGWVVSEHGINWRDRSCTCNINFQWLLKLRECYTKPLTQLHGDW